MISDGDNGGQSWLMIVGCDSCWTIKSINQSFQILGKIIMSITPPQYLHWTLGNMGPLAIEISTFHFMGVLRQQLNRCDFDPILSNNECCKMLLVDHCLVGPRYNIFSNFDHRKSGVSWWCFCSWLILHGCTQPRSSAEAVKDFRPWHLWDRSCTDLCVPSAAYLTMVVNIWHDLLLETLGPQHLVVMGNGSHDDNHEYYLLMVIIHMTHEMNNDWS